MRNAAIIFCKQDSFADQSFYLRFLLINSFFSCLQNMIDQFAIWRCNLIRTATPIIDLEISQRLDFTIGCDWTQWPTAWPNKYKIYKALHCDMHCLFVCYKLLRRFAKKKNVFTFTVNSHPLYIYIFSFLLNLNFIRRLITYSL
jgi:hypothetical protein